MSVKQLTEQHLKFLSLKGGCTDSSESTLVKMPHCWKSHVTAQLYVSGTRIPDAADQVLDVLEGNGPQKKKSTA